MLFQSALNCPCEFDVIIRSYGVFLKLSLSSATDSITSKATFAKTVTAALTVFFLTYGNKVLKLWKWFPPSLTSSFICVFGYKIIFKFNNNFIT